MSGRVVDDGGAPHRRRARARRAGRPLGVDRRRGTLSAPRDPDRAPAERARVDVRLDVDGRGPRRRRRSTASRSRPGRRSSVPTWSSVRAARSAASCSTGRATARAFPSSTSSTCRPARCGARRRPRSSATSSCARSRPASTASGPARWGPAASPPSVGSTIGRDVGTASFTDIRLVPFREVAGQVLDPDGDPRAGGRGSGCRSTGTCPARPTRRSKSSRPTSDVDGRLRALDVPTADLARRRPVSRRSPRRGESLELSGGSETVEVRLKGPFYR